MTEEDTFNTLKRRPFNEVLRARSDLLRSGTKHVNYDMSIREKLYRDMGWEPEDFRRMFKEARIAPVE